MTQSAAGFVRALGGAVQILFLAALVLASRGRKELLALAVMFGAGQVAAVFIVPHTNWQPPPRSWRRPWRWRWRTWRWRSCCCRKRGRDGQWRVLLGVFQGLYFVLFLQNTGYRPGLVLAGAAAAEAVLMAIFALVFSQIARAAKAVRPVQVSAAALLIFGMTWFFLRLRG